MNWFCPGGIQGRLVKLLALAIGVTALMAVAIWRLGIAPALRVALIEKQQEIARRASEQIDHFLDQRIAELQTAVKFGLIAHRQEETGAKGSLDKVLHATPQLHSISIIDSRGRASTRAVREGSQFRPALESYRSTLVFTEGRQGRVHVSEVLYSARGEPFVTIGIPLQNSDGEVDAVLAAEVSLVSLWSSISAIQVGKAGQLYIVSPGGILIAHRDPAKVALNLNLAHLDVVSRFIGRSSASSPEIQLGENGEFGLSSYSVVSKTGWGVIAEEGAATALAPLRRVEWLAGALLLFAIVGSFVLSHHFSLRITRPIRLLERGTQLISQGQLSQKIVFHSGDEVQSLAENFNRMADALKTSYDGLEARITERTSEISGLYAALAPVKPAESLDEMFAMVLERLLQATGASAAILRLRVGENRFTEYAIENGGAAHQRDVDRIGPSGSFAEAVFTRGVPIVCTDITTDFRFRRDVPCDGIRSCAVLPLIVSGALRGIIQLASRTPGHFKPEKQDHLMTMTRQMGVTIENHQLFSETERHRRESEILYTITDAARRSLHVPTLAHNALVEIVSAFGYDAGCVYLLDEDARTLHLTAEHGLAFANNASDQAGSASAALNDVAQRPELALRKDFVGQFNAQTAFLISINQRSVGAILLYGKEARDLSLADQSLLQQIGKQVGAAVENARLYEKAQRSLERIRALHEIDKAIASSLNRDTVLTVLLQKIEVFLLHKGTCMVHLFDSVNGALDRVACHESRPRESKPEREREYDNIPRLVAHARGAVSVLNLRSDPRLRGLANLEGAEFASYLGVPLIVQGQVLGVLSYFTPFQHSFTDQEVEFLTTLGGQGAIALYNARLYEEVKKQAVELENSNKIKDDFLCVVSHELKTPLLAVSGYTTLLNDGLLGELSAEQHKATLVIERNCRDLMHMVHSILEAAKLQNRTVTVRYEEISVPGLLEELAQTYDVPRAKPVDLVWAYDPVLPVLASDRDKLKHVLQNLIDNALKFTEAGKVTVTVAHDLAQRRMTFEVRDTGIGIPADQLPSIYEKFRQVDGAANRGYDGAGLGLYIVQEFVRLLGGSIQVASQAGSGSTFTVVLPYSRNKPAAAIEDQVSAEWKAAASASSFLCEETADAAVAPNPPPTFLESTR